jgi:enoyl-CoA hydratase/carnithine racemase
MTQEARLERDGAIATIVLNRPQTRNALTVAMGDDLGRIVAELHGDEKIRAVIVRGEGAAFSAGGDLDFLEERIASGAYENRRAMRAFYMRFLELRTLRMPTIAAIHGAAMGAGICVALACDLRIVAKGTKLALNFVRLGLPPGMGATLMLPRLIGPARAAELLLTGKTIDPDTALAIGLVNEVVAPDDVLPRARALAEEIAAAAPRAVAATTHMLRGFMTSHLEGALAAEAEAQALEYASEDLVEGVRAAREKRKPVFSGK